MEAEQIDTFVVAELRQQLEKAQAEIAELRASAVAVASAQRGLVAEREGLRRQIEQMRATEHDDAQLMAWGADEIVTLRAALRAYVHAQRRMLEKWAEGDAAVKQRLWQDLHACEEPAVAVLGDHATRAELSRQLDLAHDEIATLRDIHTAVLAWLDVRGALLPTAIRNELKEALNGNASTALTVAQE